MAKRKRMKSPEEVMAQYKRIQRGLGQRIVPGKSAEEYQHITNLFDKAETAMNNIADKYVKSKRYKPTYKMSGMTIHRGSSFDTLHDDALNPSKAEKKFQTNSVIVG